MTDNIDRSIDAYITLRDLKKQMEDDHKKQLEPIKAKMERLEGWMLKHFADTGSVSAKGENGSTMYRSTLARITITDWDTCHDFLVKEGLTHALTKKVSRKDIEDFMEETGKTVPGVQIDRQFVARVKRGTK